MNCKQGDLAIVVKSWAGNEGKIVRCIKYAGVQPWQDGEDLPSWEIDIDLPGVYGPPENIIADEQLRPIRDPGDDAQDETLTWLEVPNKETA